MLLKFQQQKNSAVQKNENLFTMKISVYLFYFSCQAYLTVSKTGLSELELQDILSLDNVFIGKIKHNFKQASNIVRVPWFYILPIIQKIEKHLITRLDNGIYVLYWRHELFAQVVYAKYIGMYAIIHANF